MVKNTTCLYFGTTSVTVIFLVLVAASFVQLIPSQIFAQASSSIESKTLGEPIYTENGKITGPYTYTANGTLANIGNVTNNGFIMTTPIGKDLLYGQGQGILSTKNGETATYTFQFIGSLSPDGQLPHGSWYIHTNSTGKMASLNNIVGITQSEIHQGGQFLTKVWEWK
jgi:hypothetical protein